MNKDVVVIVKVDDKPKIAESLEIIIFATSKEIEAKKYMDDLDGIKADWGEESIIFKKAAALFEQGKASPVPESLIREVTIVGIGEVGTPADMVEKIKEYSEVDNNWYVFMTDQNEDEYIRALAEFAASTEPTEIELRSGKEDHRKIYFAQTENKELSVNTSRSVIVYGKEEEQTDAAWIGAVGPWYPEHVTWKFKKPAGVTYTPLKASEIAILERNNINYVTDEYKNNYIKNGVCTDGEWIDSIIGGDWIAGELRKAIYTVFMTHAVIGYTDSGFTTIGEAVYDVFDRAVENNIIARDEETKMGMYTINIPKRSEATEKQIRERQLPPIKWEAQLTGAVHGAEISGKLVINL